MMGKLDARRERMMITMDSSWRKWMLWWMASKKG
jgi:hypothetical protein